MPEQSTVLVIGLGYVGSCVAIALADRGLDVTGLDTEQRVAELRGGQTAFGEHDLDQGLSDAMAAGRLRITADYAAAAAADVILVTVGTPVHGDGSVDEEQLRGACRALNPHLRRGQLVILKSTVPAGTTRSLVLPLLQEGGLTASTDFHLAVIPERLAEGAALSELRVFPAVVGGLTEASTHVAARFWRQAVGVDVLPQASLEAAEIVKLADNWWIDVNIALANELARYCALFDVDVLDVIRAANSLPKGAGSVNILLPSVGVGGSCLTKDPWMVWQSALRHSLQVHTPRVGREVNEAMPAHCARLVLDRLAARGVGAAQATVVILGLAFKNNTGDLRATPARGFIETLRAAGAEVRGHDPRADPGAAKDLLGLRPVADLHGAVRGADCVAILAWHREFESIDFSALPVAEPCLIFDGRAYFTREQIGELRDLGYEYQGVGR